MESKSGKYSTTRGKSIMKKENLISEGDMQGGGSREHQQCQGLRKEGRRSAERQHSGAAQRPHVVVTQSHAGFAQRGMQ